MDNEEAPQELANDLRNKGISNEAVLSAMAKVPRHEFVSPDKSSVAYVDSALPIGANQTISQPYVVARMTELLLGNKVMKNVLEVGTGSGYQAAILAQIVNKLYTIERIKSLYDHASQVLQKLHIPNIEMLFGDGYKGWPEHAPFDGIIVTAASDKVPKDLLDQLSENGGRLIMPVGDWVHQRLELVIRNGDQYE